MGLKLVHIMIRYHILYMCVLFWPLLKQFLEIPRILKQCLSVPNSLPRFSRAHIYMCFDSLDII